jgi:hypothetical protein
MGMVGSSFAAGAVLNGNSSGRVQPFAGITPDVTLNLGRVCFAMFEKFETGGGPFAAVIEDIRNRPRGGMAVLRVASLGNSAFILGRIEVSWT